MAERGAYAAHFPPLRPWAARLYRFRSRGVRGYRVQREPRQWRVMEEDRAARLAAAGERKRLWRYEAPGVWSMPLGLARALWWRARG